MKLRNVFKTIKNRLVLGAILWHLEKLGIIFELYYIVEEGENDGHTSTLVDDLEGYNCGFIERDELDEIAAKDVTVELNLLVQRLDHGDLCFVLRKEGNIVAYTWCDLKEFNHQPYRHDLNDNEVYLYDAQVIPDFRGKGVAPFMRIQCYRALEEYSKDTFFSVSDYSNTPAVRFKKKLGARFLKLCLHVKLWGKFERNWVLRDYFSKQETTAENSSEQRC